MSSINDLGLFDQAIWGTLHGDFFLNTNNPFNTPMSYLSIHFRPILLIFVPFYFFLPRPEWMIFAQSFALSLTAWPIYLTAKRVNKSESAAVLWAFVYMLSPFVISVPPWVFRPESLALPFIAIAFLAIEKINFRLLLLSCFFIVLCKEHFGVMVVGFGSLWGLRNRRWKQSLLLVSLGAIYSILVLGVVMPSLSPIGKHVMLGEGLGQLSRYSWLGDSLKDVFKMLLFHPVDVFKTVMMEMGGASYLLGLLIPFLVFPLAAPEFLLPGFADLLANMLSLNPFPRSVFAYHSACLVPVLIVGGMHGVRRFSMYLKKFSSTELAGFVVVANLFLGYYFAPLPLPGARNAWSPVNYLNGPDPRLPEIRYAVGEKASVSAQHNIGAYFSQRREIYCYPNSVGKAKKIVLRLEIPTTGKAVLRQHLGMDLSEYLSSVEDLLSSKDYGVLFWNDPWLVFERGLADHRSHKQIERKLEQLRKEWQINESS